MLPLDHLQGDTQVVEDAHQKILKDANCKKAVTGSASENVLADSKKLNLRAVTCGLVPA